MLNITHVFLEILAEQLFLILIHKRKLCAKFDIFKAKFK